MEEGEGEATRRRSSSKAIDRKGLNRSRLIGELSLARHESRRHARPELEPLGTGRGRTRALGPCRCRSRPSVNLISARFDGPKEGSSHMTRTFVRSTLMLALVASGHGPRAMAGSLTYTIDILSSDFYPTVQSSGMTLINDQGVAAGYIATQSPDGPYSPTFYTGGGRFQTLGVESSAPSLLATGMNDRGDLVGVLGLISGNSPYVYQGGAISYPVLPSSLTRAVFEGISDSGLVYGQGRDASSHLSEVFTVTNGQVTVLPLSAPGLASFRTGAGLLSDAGLVGVTGFSQDGSISRAMLYDTTTGTLTPLALPSGYGAVSLLQITQSGLIVGTASTALGSGSRIGFWGADGSFRGFFDAADGIANVYFNDLGQAIGFDHGQLVLYNGSSWSDPQILGLGDYLLSSISDFNDRGQFVGTVIRPSDDSLWGFVATAVPEPSSFMLQAVGIISVGVLARRRQLRSGTVLPSRY